MEKPEKLSEEIRDQLRHIRTSGSNRGDLSAFPDFLIIGPQRTGTTWIYENLVRHPQIFLPPEKETFYFNALDPKHRRYRFPTLEDYLDFMRDRPVRRCLKSGAALLRFRRLYRPVIRGEATASYAKLEPEIISEICALNPEIQAVLMLRDPIERTLSHARKDLIRDSGRPADEVSMEEYRKFFSAAGQKKLASYSECIANWQAHLQPGHLFLGEFAKISADPATLIGELCRFLGVDPEPATRNRRILGRKINPSGVEPLPEEAIEFLKELLAGEIAEYRELSKQAGQAA